ncbi:hypothetical protein FOZ63_004022, partial [Perkinsus olseni]
MAALASYEETLRRFTNQVRNMAILKGEVAFPQSSPGRSRAESFLSVITPPGLSMVKSETLDLGDVVLPMEAHSIDEYGAPGPDSTDSELYAIFELGVVTLKQYLARIYSRPSRVPKSRSRVSSCALSKAELARLVVPLLEMMYAVHAKGLVHLDMKPGNVMLGRANKWKIIDFDGAVKAGSVLNPEDSLVAFTAAYCSPELARAVVDLKSRTSRGRVGGGGGGGVGDAAVVVSRKMDVWSLGITICEIFSG